MPTQEQAREIAQAFFGHFFDAEKRVNTEAFKVYAADSIARITRAKDAETTEDVTLNGVDSVTMYNLALPPSALTLVHFDALPANDGAIVIMATGTEIINIEEFQWSRTLVLAPTPQGGFYLKSDMLHYQVGTPLPTTTTEETVQVVITPEPTISYTAPVDAVAVVAATDDVKPKKARAAPREKKPRQPRTPVTQVNNEEDVVVVATPENVVVEDVVVEPVAVVEEVAVVVEPVVETVPVPVPVPTLPKVTPQNSKKSWSDLVSGKEAEKRQPKRKFEEKKVEENTTTTTTTTTPTAPTPAPKAVVEKPQQQRVNPAQQAIVKNIPANTTKDALMLALVQVGDVADIYYADGKTVATVTFKTVREAEDAISIGSIPFNKATLTIVAKNPPTNGGNGFRSQRK